MRVIVDQVIKWPDEEQQGWIQVDPGGPRWTQVEPGGAWPARWAGDPGQRGRHRSSFSAMVTHTRLSDERPEQPCKSNIVAASRK